MSAGRRALLAAAIGLWLAPPVGAQSIDLGSGGGRGQLIEIVAKDGIEWQRETRRYIARGEARATQGDTSIFADMLIAYYREKPEGGTEIFRYEAKGNTRIATPTQTAIGDDGVYDIDAAVIVLTGRNLKLTTPNETITARDSLEYWEARRMAVARGATPRGRATGSNASRGSAMSSCRRRPTWRAAIAASTPPTPASRFSPAGSASPAATTSSTATWPRSISTPASAAC
ncbi:MAG: hypothetical protein HY057_04595 [Rhodospirillales bacterium]|nr:hypothetical protein [Rhodospirillales bacterium]